MMAFIVSS